MSLSALSSPTSVADSRTAPITSASQGSALPGSWVVSSVTRVAQAAAWWRQLALQSGSACQPARAAVSWPNPVRTSASSGWPRFLAASSGWMFRPSNLARAHRGGGGAGGRSLGRGAGGKQQATLRGGGWGGGGATDADGAQVQRVVP